MNMNTYLVEFVSGGATRRVRAEGWFDDGRSYLILDRFRVDHDARFEHTEVVELFAKAELIGLPRLTSMNQLRQCRAGLLAMRLGRACRPKPGAHCWERLSVNGLTGLDG